MTQRNTVVLSNLQELLAEAQHPMSVGQIMAALKKKQLEPNKTTVYRILQKLITKDEVTEISLKQSGSVYEKKGAHHHHHFICESCKTVFCLNHCHVHTHGINLNQLLPNPGFKIHDHDFNLYGTCEACVS